MMREMRVAAVMVVMVVMVTGLALPYPTHTTPTTPLPAQQVAATVEVKEGSGGGGGSGSGGDGFHEERQRLLDAVRRVDSLLRRPNDYNEIMLESGEEEDQLSRLLYKLQAGERVREGIHGPPNYRHHGSQPHGQKKHQKHKQPQYYLPNTLQQVPSYYTF